LRCLFASNGGVYDIFSIDTAIPGASLLKYVFVVVHALQISRFFKLFVQMAQQLFFIVVELSGIFFERSCLIDESQLLVISLTAA